MNIAFFNYLMLEYGGGTARFFEEVSVGLKKRYPNLNITIITCDESIVKVINNLYSFYFNKKVEDSLIMLGEDIGKRLKKQGVAYINITSFAQLRDVILKFDRVYSKNDFLEASILKFFAGLRGSSKLIFGIHTPIHYERPHNWQSRLHNLLYDSLFYRFLLGDAARFHVLNDYDEKKFRLSFKDKDIVKIYNPFNFRDLEEGVREKNKLSKNRDRLNLLWVGRLTQEKGADDLIKLINVLNRTMVYKKITWNVVGVGELQKDIKKLESKFNNINYLGYVNNKSLGAVYRNNDLFISTSRWESFPYTFLEAQCYGLPIISYNIHGCNEIIKDEVNGYLVESFKALTEKIIYLVNHRQLVIKSEVIYKFIKKLINSDQIYEKLHGLFTRQ